jgi:glycosyltransferase involved in cell wall biosynthesis
MRKIKVLHIVQSNGGVAEYLKMFFKHIDKDKFELDLLCSQQYEGEKLFFKEIGYNLTIINMTREISPFEDVKCVLQIAKYIRKTKPDIIHLHSSKAGALGRLASIFFRVPVVYNPHGWAFDMNISLKKKKLYVFIEKILGKFTNTIVNISDYEKKCALKYNIVPEEKIKVIYNGVEVYKYKKELNVQEIMKELDIPKDAFVIGMVGRITEQKSPDIFVKIANNLKNKIENCYFILVGDGDLRDTIKEKVDTYGLKDKFLITGWTIDVHKYISIFDVGLLTSKWEGFGLVLAEYMASEKPVVASSVGGIPDVINDGYNGILVDYGNVEGFSNAIYEIKNDQELAKKLVENGCSVVNKKFNVETVVREHEILYLSLKNPINNL